MKLKKALKTWNGQKIISMNQDGKTITLNIGNTEASGIITIVHESGKRFQYQRLAGVTPPKKYEKEVKFLDDQFKSIDWDSMEDHKNYYDDKIVYKKG